MDNTEIKHTNNKLEFSQRRGKYFNADNLLTPENIISDNTVALFEKLDLIYRTLCSILYNFVPTSGHPGGSISSGRFVESIMYNFADYDFLKPFDDANDIISYAAGHKALGLYAMFSLRNEIVRAHKPELLPEEKYQLRFEDLLGFRRNPTNTLPLFTKFNSKALDGHPTPATPFVRLATGASGVGVPSSFGYALGALDYYGEDSPTVNVIEGEGGMTPGRVSEALAAASALRLYNVIMHIDFNQASIDSNRVCRDGDKKGDYVQWNPAELCYLHDFNVIYVNDGKDFKTIYAAQKFAKNLDNKMPTAIVYKTIKGWQYGIEGKASHGAGHKFCSEAYYETLKPFEKSFNVKFPTFKAEPNQINIEQNFYDTLMTLREVIEKDSDISSLAVSVQQAGERLKALNRKPRINAPKLELLYDNEHVKKSHVPDGLKLEVNTVTTLRGVLGQSLGYLNKVTQGAFFGVAADLLGSTSVNLLGEGFQNGYFDSVDNPNSRILSIGGICEDAIGAMMAGLSAFGKHIGVSSSYGAFISAMEHTAARLHGIGEQNKVMHYGGKYHTWILINAHAGLKTGEDGPTHADPQCLQLIQENFPPGVLITLTPCEPGEIWYLLSAGLMKRPAILSPFVTRPNEKVMDRKFYNIADASESVNGVYTFRKAEIPAEADATIILQESGVTIEFITKVLPLLDSTGYNLNIFYISSAELFDLLDDEVKKNIYPHYLSHTAMGVTGFTKPTMYRWVTGEEARKRILHPFLKGHYLGSGNAESVMMQAGLDGDNILKEVKKYIDFLTRKEPAHF